MDRVINIADYREKKIKKEQELEQQMIQQEYDEFIKLLKFFVELEEPKIDVVRIRATAEGKYILYDDNCEELQKEILNEAFNEIIDTGEINYDDFLISSLITLAPKKIIIYNSERMTKEIKKTIIEVFTHKVIFKEKEDISLNKIHDITTKYK
jgi:putative sporulation protein YtxC